MYKRTPPKIDPITNRRDASNLFVRIHSSNDNSRWTGSVTGSPCVEHYCDLTLSVDCQGLETEFWALRAVFHPPPPARRGECKRLSSLPFQFASSPWSRRDRRVRRLPPESAPSGRRRARSPALPEASRTSPPVWLTSRACRLGAPGN